MRVKKRRPLVVSLYLFLGWKEGLADLKMVSLRHLVEEKHKEEAVWMGMVFMQQKSFFILYFLLNLQVKHVFLYFKGDHDSDNDFILNHSKTNINIYKHI